MKILRGGSENLYTSKPTGRSGGGGGGKAPKKLNH